MHEHRADVDEALHAGAKRRFSDGARAIDRDLADLVGLPGRADGAVDDRVAAGHGAIHVGRRADVADDDVPGQRASRAALFGSRTSATHIPAVALAEQLDGPAAEEPAGAGDEHAASLVATGRTHGSGLRPREPSSVHGSVSACRVPVAVFDQFDDRHDGAAGEARGRAGRQWRHPVINLVAKGLVADVRSSDRPTRPSHGTATTLSSLSPVESELGWTTNCVKLARRSSSVARSQRDADAAAELARAAELEAHRDLHAAAAGCETTRRSRSRCRRGVVRVRE